MEKVEQLELFTEDERPYTRQDKNYNESDSKNNRFESTTVTYDEFLHNPEVIEYVKRSDKQYPNNKYYFESRLERLSKKYHSVGFKPYQVRLFKEIGKNYGMYRLTSFYAKKKFVRSDYLLERLDGMTVNKLQKDFNSTLYNGGWLSDNLTFQKDIKSIAHGILKYFKASELYNVSVNQNVAHQVLFDYKDMKARVDMNKDNTFNVLVYKTKYAQLAKVCEFGVPRSDAFKLLYNGVKQLEQEKIKEGNHPMKDIDDELNNAHKAYLFARKIASEIDFDGVKEKDIEKLLDTVQRIQNIGAMVEYQIEDYKESRGE